MEQLKTSLRNKIAASLLAGLFRALHDVLVHTFYLFLFISSCVVVKQKIAGRKKTLKER